MPRLRNIPDNPTRLPSIKPKPVRHSGRYKIPNTSYSFHMDDIRGVSKQYGRNWTSTSGNKAPININHHLMWDNDGISREVLGQPGGEYYNIRTDNSTYTLTPDEYNNVSSIRNTFNRPTIKPRYSSGGFFRDNAGDITKTVLGAGLAFVPGMQSMGIGMAAGGIGGMISNAAAKDSIEEPVVDRWAINNRHNYMNNRTMAPSMFFNTGGRMPKVQPMRPTPNSVINAPGGHLEQEASNAFSVQGRSHEQGGVQLPGGEVEGDEMMIQSPYDGSTQVHSDELGYAQHTEQLSQLKGQYEEQLAQKAAKLETLLSQQQSIASKLDTELNRFEKNKIQREVEALSEASRNTEYEVLELQSAINFIDSQIENIFQTQEQQAEEMGMRDEQGQPVEQPMFRSGGSSNHRWLDEIEVNADAIRSPYMSGLPNRGISIHPSIGGKKPVSAMPVLTSSFNREQWANTLNQSTPSTSINADVSSNTKDLSNLSSVLPFIDNIYNVYADRKLNQIPPPKRKMLSTPTMDANYNINPQLENVASQTAAYDEYVRGNVSNAAIARSAHSANRVSNLRATNELYGQKFNAEAAIRNRNLELAANVDAHNIDADYANQLVDFQKGVSSINRRSANVANLASKFAQLKTQENLKDYQSRQLEVISLLAGDTSIPGEIRTAISNIGDNFGGWKNLKELEGWLDEMNITGTNRTYMIDKFKSTM